MANSGLRSVEWLYQITGTDTVVSSTSHEIEEAKSRWVGEGTKDRRQSFCLILGEWA
jgi:hypothetical protein